MKRIILIYFLLSGCSYNHTENNDNLSDMIFSKDLSFEEFKIQLDEYATNSSFTNIDN